VYSDGGDVDIRWSQPTGSRFQQRNLRDCRTQSTFVQRHCNWIQLNTASLNGQGGHSYRHERRHHAGAYCTRCAKNHGSDLECARIPIEGPVSVLGLPGHAGLALDALSLLIRACLPLRSFINLCFSHNLSRIRFSLAPIQNRTLHIGIVEERIGKRVFTSCWCSDALSVNVYIVSPRQGSYRHFVLPFGKTTESWICYHGPRFYLLISTILILEAQKLDDS
jgi:hypothetical protein